MKIHNPNNLPTVDYRGLEPLQGNLKDLTEKNYNKLKTILETRGFTIPLFLWRKTDLPIGQVQASDAVNVFYLMDGHQRHRIMLRENMNDEGNYKVPYILIEATNRKEAKAQLLEISSQFGTMTHEGFDEFTDELDNADFENVAFDALQFVANDDTGEDNNNGNDDNHAIIISFSDVAELDKCLIDVQEVCEKYGSAQIKVKE
jgi:hypothetical protein